MPAGDQAKIVGSAGARKTPAANASSSGARSRFARSQDAAIPKPQMSDCAADKRTSASSPAASGSGVKRTMTSGTKRSPMICATVPQTTAAPERPSRVGRRVHRQREQRIRDDDARIEIGRRRREREEHAARRRDEERPIPNRKRQRGKSLGALLPLRRIFHPTGLGRRRRVHHQKLNPPRNRAPAEVLVARPRCQSTYSGSGPLSVRWRMKPTTSRSRPIRRERRNSRPPPP